MNFSERDTLTYYFLFTRLLVVLFLFFGSAPESILFSVTFRDTPEMSIV